MADLVCYIPNHGYAAASNTFVYVSWLDTYYWTADEDTDSFKLATTTGGSTYVQSTGTVTDGYVVESGAIGSATITGLEHLEGEFVSIVQEGIVVDKKTVASGSVTAIKALATPMVGMTYTSTVKPMRLDIGEIGLASTKRINRAIVDVHNTVGGEIGISTDKMEDIPTGTSALFEGFKEISISGGYNREGDIIVRQTEALPMTVRGITLDLGAEND